MINGEPVPIGFFSKKLSDQQRRYSTYDRELLAAYYAVLHFKHLLDGKTVTLCTDHRPLVSAFTSRNPAKTDRQQRNLSCISEYISSMVYIRGHDNIVADCLSRNVNAISIDAIDLPAIAHAQKSDNEIKDYLHRLQDFPLQKDLVIKCDTSTYHPRPFLPQSQRKSIFNELHNISHPGQRASLRLIKSRYFWPEMNKNIIQWTRECTNCQSAKIYRHVKTDPTPLDIPSTRFETVHIDLVGPLLPCPLPGAELQCSYKYLLTCIDRGTKWIEAVPLINITAKSVAFAFLHGWVSRFGIPLYLLTDRGAQFESELFTELSKLLGFHRLRTASYRPQTNSQIERAHRTFKTAITARKQDWMTALPVVLLGIRCLPAASTGISPFTMVTGKTPLSPRDLFQKDPQNNKKYTDTFVQEFSKRMRELDFKDVPTYHPTSQKPYIPDELRNSTHVWVRVDRVRRPLEAPYTGPFEVIEKFDKTFKLKFPSGPNMVSIERLKPAVLPNKEPTPQEPEPEPAPQEPEPEPTPQANEPEPTEPIVTTRYGRRVKFRNRNDYRYF